MKESDEKETVNILLVEDDELALQLASIIIQGIGNDFRLYTAFNGQEALDIINSTPIDMLITDIMMPVMDGFDLIERVRKMPSMIESHIIIITSLRFTDQKVRGFDLGANDYITKPFDHKELRARVGAGIRDIILRKKLKKAYKELEKASEFKRLLLGRVAHDLRTPISIIEGYLHIIKDNYTNISRDDFDTYFNNIINQSRFINSICRDILDFTALDMGKLTLELNPYSIESVVREAVMLNSPQAKAREVEIEVEIESIIPPVLMDSHRATGVFWNLLNNAVKYSKKGSKINILIKRDSSKVMVAVKDKGRGISPETKEHLFTFFAKDRTEDDTGVGSVGLGLAISKRLMELQGGDITVESKEGEGSTFTVTLPVA